MLAGTNVRTAIVVHYTGIGVSMGVGVRVHKNINLANTIDRDFIFYICIPCDKTFQWVPKCLT